MKDPFNANRDDLRWIAILGHGMQLADADLPPGLLVVEALFELASPLVLGILGDRF
jgi:hypothetical protein